MSSTEALAGLIQEINIFTEFYYIDLVVSMVTIYDWILTFPDEFHIMWKHPLTGSRVLFLLNRYVFIAIAVNNIMSDHILGINTSCSNLGISSNLFVVLHNLVVSVFQILRVYAISGRRKRYAFLIAASLVFPNFFTIYIWAKSFFGPVGPPLRGCSTTTAMSENTYNKLLIGQRVGFIVGEAIVVIVTIHQTYGTVKASRQANIQSTFSTAVLNAGILYFSVMFAMNTIDFIVALTSAINYFSNFPELFQYLLTSHFLLNLQEMSTITTNGSNRSHTSFARSTRGEMSSIHFADLVVGNLGESLRDGSCDADKDDDADDDDMARVSDIEKGPLPHIDEEPERATLSNSEDTPEENVAGPSRLPLDAQPQYATSEMHV